MDVHPPKNGINRYWSIPILPRHNSAQKICSPQDATEAHLKLERLRQQLEAAVSFFNHGGFYGKIMENHGKSWKIMVVSHWISCFQWEKHWTKWFYWWNNGGFSVAMVDCSWFIGEPTMIVAIIYLPGRYGQLQFTVDVSYQMIHIIIYIYI